MDPFGCAYTGKSQNDPGEVRAWLDDLDRYARTEVGALDLVLTAHMGWAGEHVRGASSLEDWADSIAYLTASDNGSGTSARSVASSRSQRIGWTTTRRPGCCR